MTGFIEQRQWKSFLNDFSKRNQHRATRMEVVGDIGAQEEKAYLPLVGVTLEPRGTEAGSVAVVLGGYSGKNERRVERLIQKVERIAPLVGISGLEDGLGFEAQDGVKTLLTFEKLPEIPEKASGH